MPKGIYIHKPHRGWLKKGHKINLGKKNRLGKKHTEETKTKLRNANLGESNPRYGSHHSEETKQKIRLGNLGKNKGENSRMWKGGLSYQRYPIDWTQTLRRSIRERDRYTCQLCGEPQGDRAIDVHHINYDKRNCNPSNLITLCRKCNIRVNKHREYWTQYFQEKLNKQ